METTWTVTCPACWSTLPIVVEPQWGSQVFIEDCSVCCRPMEVSVEVEDGEVVSVTVEPA